MTDKISIVGNKMTTGLELLREPFNTEQISKLPKGTKAQNECPIDEKINCDICGGFHHPRVKHLDYVGHAEITDRLLDADINWTWEPFAISADGLPVFDGFGGMWIKLTVCGVTRIGYGDSSGKDGPNAVKEVIGDALRNTAMRFGAGIDLWKKKQPANNDYEKKNNKKTNQQNKPIDQLTADAYKIRESVDSGDELGAALWLSKQSQERIDDIWGKLDSKTKASLREAWPQNQGV